MTEWRDCKFGEIATFSYGKMPNKKNIVDCGYPIFSGYKIVGYYNSYMYEDPQLIIVARGVGGTGDVKISPPKSYITNLSIIAELHPDKANKKFLYYYFKINNLRELDSGSAQSQITINDLNNYCITLPPLPEQKAIAEVLSSLDDKIDLLTRQNKTLEDLAQAYFRKWFIEDASDKWEEKGLDEIADFLNGLPLQKYPYKTGNPLHVIKIKELNNGFTDSSDLCSADIPEQYIVHPGDVIFSWSGSLKVDIWKYGKGALNQHLFKVTSCNYPKWFYYFWIKYHLPEFKMIAESKATTMGHIQRRDLSNAIVLVPENQEINNMDNIMSPLIKKIEQNNAQILVLQKLRDTLLPKLISGEIRVKM